MSERTMPWRLQERVNRGDGWGPWRSIGHFKTEAAAQATAVREAGWQKRHGLTGREYRAVHKDHAHE